MKVTLKHYTPLHIAAEAIRTCWQSQENSDTIHGLLCLDCGHIHSDADITKCSCGSYRLIEDVDCGPKDRELIERVGVKFRHASTLEHILYNFYIEGISRAVLQELARHRMASLSVKSTRYTLKELKDEEPFMTVKHDYPEFGLMCIGADIDHARAEKYIVFTGIQMVDNASILALEGLRGCLQQGISNDKAKYCLPESYRTSLTWTINMRSLQNFLSLRTNKAALWEIRDLANAIYDALPEDHKYLLEPCVKTN